MNSHRVSAAATQVLKKKSTRQQHGGVNTGIAQAPVNSVTAGWMTRMTTQDDQDRGVDFALVRLK